MWRHLGFAILNFLKYIIGTYVMFKKFEKAPSRRLIQFLYKKKFKKSPFWIFVETTTFSKKHEFSNKFLEILTLLH